MYSILQYLDGQETTSEAHHPGTVEDEFRQIYFDALDTLRMPLKKDSISPASKHMPSLKSRWSKEQ